MVPFRYPNIIVLFNKIEDKTEYRRQENLTSFSQLVRKVTARKHSTCMLSASTIPNNSPFWFLKQYLKALG